MPQLLRQPVGGQAVGQPVVHRLDPAAHLHGDLAGRHAEDPGRRLGVEVMAGGERLLQRGVAGQVGHDPQLDLAVVGGEQRLVAAADHEALPDPAALLGADRDVLQVRVGGREPPGGRDHLVVGGVDPAVLVSHRDQRVHDALQPGDVPVAEQVLQHRVAGLGEQAGERLGVGGVPGLDPLGLGQAQLGEQHFLELLGRAEVELVPDDPERRLLGRLHLAAQAGGHVREVVGVGRDPGPLHPGQHADERQFDVGQQLGRRRAAPGPRPGRRPVPRWPGRAAPAPPRPPPRRPLPPRPWRTGPA